MDFGTIRINYQAAVNETRRRKSILLNHYKTLKRECNLSPEDHSSIRNLALQLEPFILRIHSITHNDRTSLLEATRLNHQLSVKIQDRIEVYQEIIARKKEEEE